MSNQENEKILETDKELHEEAGLQYAGVDDEGELLYIGADKNWKKFNLLTQ